MSFSKDFLHEIFISYASPDGAQALISTFRDKLEQKLHEKGVNDTSDSPCSLDISEAVFGNLTGEDARPTLWRGCPRPRRGSCRQLPSRQARKLHFSHPREKCAQRADPAAAKSGLV